RWRREELQLRHLDVLAQEERLELLDQAWLADFVRDAGPVLQPADDHGVVRQVHERAGAEGGHHLAVAHLAVRSGVGSLAHSSSSTSTLSSVRTQRFTDGSTSRIERLARNFLCRGLSFLSSGSKNVYRSGRAAPSSCWYWRLVPTPEYSVAIFSHSSSNLRDRSSTVWRIASAASLFSAWSAA